MANKKYNYKTGGSLLTRLQGKLDMSQPGMGMKNKKGCCCQKMNMGGTVPTANTYYGK